MHYKCTAFVVWSLPKPGILSSVVGHSKQNYAHTTAVQEVIQKGLSNFKYLCNSTVDIKQHNRNWENHAIGRLCLGRH